MNNFDRLYLYYGVPAMGWKVEGFKEVYMGINVIGFNTLKAVEEHPTLYKVRPILKPWILAKDKIIKTVKETIDDGTFGFGAFNLIQLFRSFGYDCDELIKKDLAVIDSKYKHLI